MRVGQKLTIMAKHRYRKNECIYCGSREKITSDHIPPKCLFPDPKPTNLITVPSCEKCNNSYKKDDEYFRICILAQLDVSPTGWKISNEKVIGSSLKRSPSLRKHLPNSLIPVKVRSPSGLYLGDAEALQFAERRINHVVKRIVRGLYWHHYRISLLPDVSFLVLKDPDISGVVNIIQNHTKLVSVEAKTFQYRYGVAAEDPRQSVWLLRFYEVTSFLIVTGADEAAIPEITQ
jgi:hypothetical protein